METGITPPVLEWARALETFLVEWKRGVPGRHVERSSLETFLVEWKLSISTRSKKSPSDLETFLVEWKPPPG